MYIGNQICKINHLYFIAEQHLEELQEELEVLRESKNNLEKINSNRVSKYYLAVSTSIFNKNKKGNSLHL